jgi:flagellar protein FlaG
MKVDGIDPLILNRVKDQTTKPVVQEAERSNVQQTRIKQQQEQARQAQVMLQSDQGLLQEIEDAVMKLNDTAEAMQLSLRFLMHRDSERWMVQVVDIRHDEIVREIPPEKILNVVAQIQSLIGVLLDERR